MPLLNDPVVDELQNKEGNVFIGRAPAQGWLRPERVSLRTINRILHPLNKLRSNVARPELEFVLLEPLYRSAAAIHQPQRRIDRVKPSGQILEKFLSLASASDNDILDFASKFGPLLIFCRKEYAPGKDLEMDQLVIVESCQVWRYFAACMRSLLRIAARFHAGRAPDPADWGTIGKYPPPVGRAKEEANKEPVDWLNPSPSTGEEAWKIMAHFVGKGKDRDRAMWTRLLNVLLGLGRVRPWVLWAGPENDARPKVVFSGPNLLSHLAIQLCLVASKQDSFAICSYCNSHYTPQKRAPKAGQRNFCPECRESGVPVRIAQRRRRAKLRKELSSL
jgi:hypothetical protein